jgi:hypothetical protein
MLMLLHTFANSDTAAGVWIIVETGRGSPPIASANEIAPAVPPSGTAMLAPKVHL